MKKCLFIIVAGLFFFQTFFSGISYAIGAIAYSEGEDAYGIVTGYDDKESAFAEAKKFCRQAGGTKCKGLVWFKKCGALATSSEYFGYGYGSTKKEAETEAKSACKGGCTIAVSDCE